MNQGDLLTKDFFDAKLDSGFAKQRSHLDACFDRSLAHLEARFDKSNALMDAHFDALEAKLRHNHRVWLTMQLITIVAVVYPYSERLMAL